MKLYNIVLLKFIKKKSSYFKFFLKYFFNPTIHLNNYFLCIYIWIIIKNTLNLLTILGITKI